VAYSLNGGKLKKQLAEANDQGAGKVVFFGSDRAPEGSYEVKDLGTGDQKILREDEL
jgi:histidyl-tRNA synthetase